MPCSSGGPCGSRRAEDGSGEASVVVGLADVEGGEAFRGFGLDGYIVDGG